MRPGLLPAPRPFPLPLPKPRTMLQRSKSAGKQPNRPGYLPLPATNEEASGSSSRDRNRSPLPDNVQRRAGPPKQGAKPGATKRMIAPGQVCPVGISITCEGSPAEHLWNYRTRKLRLLLQCKTWLRLTMRVLLAACAWSKIQGEVRVSP